MAVGQQPSKQRRLNNLSDKSIVTQYVLFWNIRKQRIMDRATSIWNGVLPQLADPTSDPRSQHSLSLRQERPTGSDCPREGSASPDSHPVKADACAHTRPCLKSITPWRGLAPQLNTPITPLAGLPREMISYKSVPLGRTIRSDL